MIAAASGPNSQWHQRGSIGLRTDTRSCADERVPTFDFAMVSMNFVSSEYTGLYIVFTIIS